MNEEWSNKQKVCQALLKKEASFQDGINCLIELRNDLFHQVEQVFHNFPSSAFYEQPYIKTNGHGNKTIVYTIYHTMRIEDIVCHTLILNDEQVFFKNDYQNRMHSSITTTGNELTLEEVGEFSKKIDPKELLQYMHDVMEISNQFLKELTYEESKRTFTKEDYIRLEKSSSVSELPKAKWLIDYWCEKDIRGLLAMPFSRHWIMHIEAMLKIKNKLCQQARKNVNPVAYCGLSCNHCFLGKWCGSCRTNYNTCSFAKISPGGICENVACCKEKGIDGCYECEKIETCVKGFYTSSNDSATNAKANALFIQKYGVKAHNEMLEKLHDTHSYKEVETIIGKDTKNALEKMVDIWKRK